MRTPVWWLSMHVPYMCRDEGACCSSGWPIPVERERVSRLQALRAGGSWLLPAPAAPADVGGVLATSFDGHCVFHRNGCEIQRAYGHAALPSACQHFPREVLIDPRGVHVTLSHYCPTAAELLFTHTGPVHIVEGPPVLPDGEPEGLDAREVLPPLLTDGVLMDHVGYTAWEAHMVRVLTGDDSMTPEQALAQLERDAATIRAWRPGAHTLEYQIARLSHNRPLATIPPSTDAPEGVVIRRYLAARSFASWFAYQGHGLEAVLASLRFMLAALRDEIARQTQGGALPRTRAQLKDSVRQTDLRLLHLIDRDELVREVAASQA